MHSASKTRHVGLRLAIVSLLGAAPLRAVEPAQPLELVRAAAQSHVRGQLTSGEGTAIVTAAALDPRLRLAACAGALQTFSPPGTASPSARRTVGVRCSDGAAWTVYVPVLVELERPVLVLRRAALRGAQLTAEDVTVQTLRVRAGASAFIGSIEELEGRSLKRPLAAGAVLTADAFVANFLVRRGQQVTLVASAGGVQVRMAGKALADGRAGSRLKVQNLSSLTVVEGTVESGSVIRVTP